MNHVTMAAQRWEIVYKDLLKSLSTDGQKISPRKGAAREIIGGTFKLENPRDRCLLSPARGFNVFQAVGKHWLWIMAGRMDLPSINYYNPRAPTFSADLRKLDGAYGPRLFGLGVLNQIPHIIDLVAKNPDTRRAVASVYIPEFDSSRTTVQGREDEVPCTIAMQFLPRGGSLNMIVFMRSQDAFGVLPYDLFIFTLIQEFIAKSTKSEVGNYNLHAGSMHYYLRDEARVQEVLTEPPVAAPIMPAMPDGSQDEFLKKVLELEEAIRVECSAHIRLPFRTEFSPRDYLQQADELHDFWKTIVHCLLASAAIQLNNEKALRRVHDEIAKPFDFYTERALSMLAVKAETSLDKFLKPPQANS